MSTMNMKPNRIALFLAKILGKPEGENIKPSNATEYYLNELAENGSGRGAFVVIFSGTTAENNASCNKTWDEIVTAMRNNQEIIAKYRRASYVYDLATKVRPSKSLEGFFTETDTGDVKMSIHCLISTSAVECYYSES